MARKTHRFGIVLKSELNKSETFEELQKSLDVAVLNDAGVYILAWNWETLKSKPGQEEEDEKPESKNKLLALIKKKAPGILAFLKKYKWWQIYLGMAFVILMAQFIWNLLH